MVDWEKIERLMLKSFTGHGLTDAEMELVQAAHKKDPAEYKRRSQAVRYAEIKERQRMFR